MQCRHRSKLVCSGCTGRETAMSTHGDRGMATSGDDLERARPQTLPARYRTCFSNSPTSQNPHHKGSHDNRLDIRWFGPSAPPFGDINYHPRVVLYLCGFAADFRQTFVVDTQSRRAPTIKVSFRFLSVAVLWSCVNRTAAFRKDEKSVSWRRRIPRTRCGPVASHPWLCYADHPRATRYPNHSDCTHSVCLVDSRSWRRN